MNRRSFFAGIAAAVAMPWKAFVDRPMAFSGTIDDMRLSYRVFNGTHCSEDIWVNFNYKDMAELPATPSGGFVEAHRRMRSGLLLV